MNKLISIKNRFISRLSGHMSLITLLAFFSLLLSSCFTGIEGTKKITLSKSDIKEIEPTAEEKLFANMSGIPDSLWLPGKLFVVSDDKASIMIDPVNILSGDIQLHQGDVMKFLRRDVKIAPDGKRESSAIFQRGNDTFIYVSQDAQNKLKPIYSDNIPGLIDTELVASVGSVLKGKRLWTRTHLWLNADGERIDGRKFEEVDILDVSPGNMVFPVKLKFRDSSGNVAYLLMNYGEGGKDSRSFSNLFYLENPRNRYPGISDKTWANICKGVVELGMTKDECRLAKGNPVDIRSGHDYSKEMLIWSFPDATVLYFEDGILTGINRL